MRIAVAIVFTAFMLGSAVIGVRMIFVEDEQPTVACDSTPPQPYRGHVEPRVDLWAPLPPCP